MRTIAPDRGRDKSHSWHRKEYEQRHRCPAAGWVQGADAGLGGDWSPFVDKAWARVRVEGDEAVPDWLRAGLGQLWPRAPSARFCK